MIKIISLLLLLTNIALAEQRIHIYIEADEYGEYIDNDIVIGSEWSHSEDAYILDKIIPISQLPYSTCLLISCLTIRESGYVSFGGFVRDQDAGSESFFFIPKMNDGSFFGAAEPYHFNVESGDYASGLWSISADIKIVILDL